MQHRAPRNTPGRHRRTEPLHSHRAPREPIAEKGRYAVAAALVAGVGVTAVTVAGDDTAQAGGVGTPPTRIAAQAVPAPSTSAGTTDAASGPAGTSGTPATGGPGTSPGAAGASSPGAGTAGASGTAGTAGASGTAGTAGASGTAVTTGASGTANAAGGSADAIGSDTTGIPFVAQRRKAKPLPLWVNPMPEGAVTSCFGPRWGRLHAGVDLAAASGTPIRAAGRGVVVAAGPAEGYGNAVLIDHGNGYLTHYGHMSVITATAGRRVAPGDQIGEEGSTGHSTGPHLHFEVHKGSYQNPVEPTQWMHDRGVDIRGCTTFKN